MTLEMKIFTVFHIHFRYVVETETRRIKKTSRPLTH